MGLCVGTERRSGSRRPSAFSDSTSSSNGGEGRGSGSSTKNRPLRHEKIRWKSDIPLTEGQLKSKRDEFWDTAPAFDGKQEIWNALKAAVEATETNNDYDLAQAILDGAGVSMPNGSLVECYDELGTRYAIPVYCLSMPINLVTLVHDDAVDSSGRIGEKGFHPDTPAHESEPVIEGGDLGPEVKLKIRISLTESDCRIVMHSGQTIAAAKKKLTGQVDKMVDPSRQRWYFGGKLLSDKMRISDCNIPPGHVIQCVVNDMPVQFDVIRTTGTIVSKE